MSAKCQSRHNAPQQTVDQPVGSSSNTKPIFWRPSNAVLPYSFSISLAKLGE
jgi:hypothetical protein